MPDAITHTSNRGAPTTAPRWVARVRHVTCAWALAYGALRLWWVVTDTRPVAPPLGDDLLLFAGGGSVVLCLAAAFLAVATGWGAGVPVLRWLLPVAAWIVAAMLAAACCLLVLDLVGIVFPGVGIPVAAGAVANRGAGLVCALLLAASALLTWRVERGACPGCGRRRGHAGAADPRVTGWAVAAAYATVVACLVRVGTQLAVGFDLDGMAASPGTAGRYGPVAFLVCVIASGTVLPLALVHRWGRTVPGWMPVLAGRTVPRWLLLVPALLVSGSLVTYFGTGMVQLASGALRASPTGTAGELSPAFLWSAVSAYLVWGLGLGAAALAYLGRTRPACRRCGAGRSH